MFIVGCTAALVPTSPADADVVTDLVETVVDELDRLGMDPDVATVGFGTRLEIRIEVSVDSIDMSTAMSEGVSAIRTGLHAAQVNTTEMGQPDETNGPHLFHLAGPLAQARPVAV